MRNKEGKQRKGQVTLFVILALIIVAGISVFFFFDIGLSSTIDTELLPAYNHYLSCLEETASQGIGLLGAQGGVIDVGTFEPGSPYKPFSSHMDFFGSAIPYWFYASGNNVFKENVPTLTSMETELETYITERLTNCDFTDFELAGFLTYIETGDVDVSIEDFTVEITATNPVTIFNANTSSVAKEHTFTVESKLGTFYSQAKDIYDFEKETVFLEQYAIDVLEQYAPVTGIEVTCSPQVFFEEEISQDIVDGLSTNIATLKVSGDYFDLSEQERNYFVTDIGNSFSEQVQFLYDSRFPTRIEMYGDRVVSPVGLQEGLGLLGFCYVPYHFVYDIDFPVLVQLYDDDELFQFPLSVVISRNQPRDTFEATTITDLESNVCEFANQDIEVHTFDWNLNPIEADISYKCLDAVCPIGETTIIGEESVITAAFPTCVNGVLKAQAEGYLDAEVPLSTNEQDFIAAVLKKQYSMPLDLGTVEQAIVTFTSEDYSTTVLYPEFTSVELVEGYYNVSVIAYTATELTFPASQETTCVTVPEEGVLGLFGSEKDKCLDIEIPATTVTHAISGGGNTQEYITEGMLIDATELNINVPLYGPPQSLEELQQYNVAVEDETIYLSFE